MARPDPTLIARLFARLRHDDVAIAADYVSGCDVGQIADRLRVSRWTVRRALDRIDEACDEAGVPRPTRVPAPDTRHVRQISPAVASCL